MRGFWIFIPSLLFLNISFAQSNFDQSELTSFTTIYLLSKSAQTPSENLIISLLDKHKITLDRYSDILRAGLEGRAIKLSQNEISLKQDIATMTLEQKNVQSDYIKKLCISHNLSFEKYETILNKYQTSIQFQNQLKPYFSNAIKTIDKNEK
ncbi:MAG: hypothetical protein R2774_08515 [Saprospiraceae bacterium]